MSTAERPKSDSPETPPPPRTAQDLSVRLVRELRGALDEEQERELTVAQCAILRREGQLTLRDPETGIEYRLVPVGEPRG